MRYPAIALGLLLLACGACSPSTSAPSAAASMGARFPIVVQGRWGFIDSTGAVVVAPRFAQVQEFAEGLAPVREAGHYGYLNEAGQLVLPQRYGYAAPFHNGRALVQPDSIPRLLDRAGRLLPLAAVYRQLEWQPAAAGSRDRGGRWVGTLPSYQRQLLAASGQLLNPARFELIGELSNNRIVVTGSEPLRNAQGNSEVAAVGVLDGRGRFVIPYYRFHDLSTFHEGLALASIYQPGNDEADHWGIIDTTGRVVARLPAGYYFSSLDEHSFSDGLAQVNCISSGQYPNDESYPAPIDHAGRVLFRRPGLRQLSAFSHGRAWAQDSAFHWQLLNKAGLALNKVLIKQVVSSGRGGAPTFADGVELVALDNGDFAALDSLGQVVRRISPPAAGSNSPQRQGNLLTFYAASQRQRLGFWNWRTGLLVPPRFSAIDYAGYRHGLLAVVEGDRPGYLSPAGRYVWRAAPAASTPLNLDFMRRGSYLVASAPLRRYAGFGGWGRSGNLARPIQGQVFAPRTLAVQVATRATPGAFGPHHGHALAIANTSADTVVFDAQDSNLALTIQARDAQGKWRAIEHTPSSWCGNSYHQVFLAPGQCWQLTVPAYAGEFATRLRVRLLRRQAKGSRKQVAVYSNEFAGSVNPAQFWRQEGYSPQDIMDPYTN
ncbi:WG repeat-containing protein [Hymenobacter cheonanensis]|uniref:WG repeat-containing protein n=1 Tax=Hymenobacter sp. CA2-7 TaxID=3063993 RepID=UPI002712B15F|nr:WG repeat-containing protein [Hymenobacter sp. CA2-7]MDO7887860.1 WG repeat-containing protein [Hymenobacter sp. CA2-7]